MTGPSRAVALFRFLVGLFVALVLLVLPFRTTIKAQEEHKTKVPVIDKITSGGPTQQAFTGIVKSVDMGNEVMNVDNVNGNSTEIFPIKKKVHVVTADGSKLKLAKLKPGTNVLVYYDQRGDHRTVTRIVVLASGAVKKKTPPS
jgi:3-dehydroquinate synthase class II